MKQFARCMNCRHWFLRTYTMAVEIFRGEGLHRVTVWCLRCVEDAERRSRPPDDREPVVLTETSALATVEATTGVLPPDSIHQLVQEHMELMERAMREDDAVLVPLIKAFMQRCRVCQQQLETSEHAQRITGHLQYWDTFLRALNQSL